MELEGQTERRSKHEMKVLRFDSVGGASGDMVLASLAALGIDMSQVGAMVAGLGIEPFRIEVEKCSEHGLAGMRVRIVVEKASARERNLSDILTVLEASSLPERTRDVAGRVFRRLAEAEGRVHGKPPEKVHFHEVGAVDSIVDIVGSCCGLVMLGVEGVRFGPLPIGHGMIESEHGVYPSPAPATVELLKGHSVIQVGEPVETVTPTGAALLVTWSEVLPAIGDRGRILSAGYGVGHRAMKSRPNVLRAVLLDTGGEEIAGDECVVLEFNVDDTTPEIIGALQGKLMSSGALDVYFTPVQMKKQRPGTLVTVIARPADSELMLDIIFSESTTFGVRQQVCHRAVLDRRHETVQTVYGQVRIKVGSWRGRVVTRSPEYDDCATCAQNAGVPLKDVYEAAMRAFGSLSQLSS